MKNWWYYHKWYVICGAVLLVIVCNLAGHALGLWTKHPDFQIAYIGEAELPNDAVTALEAAFASIGTDCNGDGEVIVRVNQYVFDCKNTAPEAAGFGYASELSLIGDISGCDSYFFLMDHPKEFQKNYHLLASPDGSCPKDTDFSTADKTILWTKCAVLSQMDLGSYSTTVSGKESKGDVSELLGGLYLGRRCFPAKNQPDELECWNGIWELLVKGT